MPDTPPRLTPATLVTADAHDDSRRLPLSRPTPGTVIAGPAVIRVRREQVTRNGKPFLQVTLGNASGSIETRVWSERLPDWEGLDVGTAVHVEASVKEGWQGAAAELDVRLVEPLPATHTVRHELNPLCPVPRADLEARLARLLALVRPGARALFEAVIAHVGEEAWWTAPAAKSMHDAYIGGLAHHSIKVASAAVALAWASDAADRIWLDAVVLGGLLHDVGKTEEYVWQGRPIDVSRRIHLTSHVCSGVVLVHAAVARAEEALYSAGMTDADVEHLCHVIVSHHGQLDYGSPVVPNTLEAALVHHADNACAKTASLSEDLATCALDRDGWADPSGWKRKPIWVAHAPALRGDRLVAAHTGSQAVTRGLRSLLDTESDGGAGGGAPRTPPGGTGLAVVLPPLSIAEAGALVHSVWTGAAQWSPTRRVRRAGLLDVAEAVVRQLPTCERDRLERYRPSSEQAPTQLAPHGNATAPEQRAA